MKKVIFASYDHIANPFYAGGGARAIHEIAKRLSSQYEVSVLTAKTNPSQSPALELDQVKYRPFGPQIFHPQLSQLIYLAELPRRLKMEKFDIVFESFTPPISSAWLPMYFDKPVVGLAHLLAARPMAEKYRLPFIKWIEALALRKYKFLIALTETSKDEMGKYAAGAKIKVIANGINLPVQDLPENPRKHWLYLGRIDERQKNLKLLIQSFELTLQNSDWRLYVAGDGSAREVEALTSKIRQSKARDRISYLGPIEGQVKERWLRSAGALILTSRFETQPIAMLEAFSYRCPVIYADIPDLSWVPAGAAFKAGRTPESMALAMNRLAKRPHETRKRAKLAAETVRDLNWDNVAAKYAQAIEEWT